MAKAHVRYTLPDEPEQVLELGDVATIGRASRSDLVIDQLDCSREHAQLRRRRDGSYELVDLGSRNGCFVNGVRIEGTRPLHDGDRITIVDVEIHFAGPSPASQPASVGVYGADAEEVQLPAVVLAADVAHFAELSRKLAPEALQEFVGAWVEDARRAIERRRGSYDRMADKAVLGYWLVDDPARPQAEVAMAFDALRALIGVREDVAPQFAQRFEGCAFQTGIGLHLGHLELGNAGATQEHVWSVAGEAVCTVAALEELAERQARAAVVSGRVARLAPRGFVFESLGACPVRDGENPIEAFALVL